MSPLQPKKTQDPSRDRPIMNRCTAHRRNGDQCRRSAIKGANVCATHGGSAPQVQLAAKVRLLMAADTVAGELIRIALARQTSDSVKVQAIIAVLDRAGVLAKQEIELHAKVETWESRIKGAVVDWGALAEGYNPTDPYVLQSLTRSDPNVIDAEIVEGYNPQDATLDVSERRDEHREKRLAEVEAQTRNLPKLPEPTPPWVSEESGAQTATRLADEHRKAEFARDKASQGLAPRKTRKR